MDRGSLDRARALLNRARLIAEAPAAQQSQIGHGHPHSQMPPGAWRPETSTLDECGERMNAAIAAGSEAELDAANRWCEEEMDSLQHAAAAGAESALEFRARLCAQYEGQLAGVVARLEMTSVTTVRKIREQAGRDARLGHVQ